MTRIVKANMIVAACLACCALCSGCSKSDSAADKGGTAAPHATLKSPEDLKKHNVLLVTLDTTRADYLSCYDSSKGKLSPNLDAIADDAVRFEFAITPAPSTPASHASILSGLWPFQHGVRVIAADAGYRLAPDTPTLTTVLKEYGWTTAAFLSAFTVSEHYGFDYGFDVFDNGLTQDASTILEDADDGRRTWVQMKHQRRSDATTDKAVAWLRSVKQRPVFMWVHYWDPHDRMVLPPEETLRRFVNPQMSEDETKRAIYRAEVNYMDAQFARLIAALKDGGLYEDTIIAIVADHGQGLGQHDWWPHRLLYQEQLHVPLLMRVPGWPTGKVVPQLVRTVDIYPTILEALGLQPRPGIAGVTLRGLMEGKQEQPRMAYTEVLNEYDLNSSVTRKRPKDNLLYGAMDRTWKLIFRYTYPEESELYNLADDRHELNNLFGQKPKQEKRLRALLDEFDGYVTAPLGSGAPAADVMEALESLGYVGGAEDYEDEPNQMEANEPATQPTAQP